MAQVSLSTFTDFVGDLNALIEDQGTSLTIRFDLDEPAPVDGLTLFVDADVEQGLNRLDLPAFAFNPNTENINFETVETNRDSSGFVATIDEGATFGSLTLTVFNNPEPDTFLPETFDGRVENTFTLLTNEQVDRDVEGPIPELSDYTIDPAAASSVVIFADDLSQLTEVPPPTTPEGPLQVSLFTGPDYLIEDEGTVSAHAFNVTNGIIPEGGLVVAVNAPNLNEFDLASVSVEGGEIVAVREGGFDLRMTEYTALVNLAISADSETEIGETASFSLAAGDGYEINEDYSSGQFSLVDTRADISQGVVTEPNDIVTVATDTAITAQSPSFTAQDSISFDIGNRYLNEDGTYTYIDYNEDVDLYRVDLRAGETVAVETFEVSLSNPRFGVLTGLSALDSEGNRLGSTGFYSPAAPDKLFGSSGPFNIDGSVNESETDGYLEFTAPADGTYYVGVSSYISSGLDFFGEENSYSIDTPGLGEDSGIVFGQYAIEIDLLTENNPRKVGTPTAPVSNADVTNPLTLSLSASPSTIDSEGNFTAAAVEFVEADGISTVNFTIQSEGEIPEGGLEFVLNSNVNLFDYSSFLGQTNLPSTIGGQSLGAFYNEDGIPTGIRLRIEEPLMTVSYEAANRNSGAGDFFGAAPFYDQFEPLETDGDEAVTFFLEAGDGYTVSPTSSTTEVTYYDSIADVPPSQIGNGNLSEVGVTVSQPNLIESEETETTITFTLSEPPSASGVTVYLDSNENPFLGSVLGQFAVLEAEVTGGDFPVPNSDASGFFFTITEQTATITLAAFDELTVISDPLTVQEGLFGFTFALQPQAGYTIDPAASVIDLTIADSPDSKIQVSLTAATESDPDSTTLVEAEGTVSVHNFSLSAAPPAEGITVSVSTEALGEFDLDAVDATGGTIAAVRADGFDFTITEREAAIRLPVLEDGIVETGETATFALEPGDDYQINQAATEVTFVLADTLADVESVGVPEEAEKNNTIAQANALGLSVANPTVSIDGAIAAYGARFPGLAFGYAEDVDLYSVELGAGQTITLDVDGVSVIAQNPSTVLPNLSNTLQTTDSELRLFDAEGNELAANNDGAAPGEDFSRDPFLQFTASETGTYYVGISQLGNRNYDPNVESSGSGWTFPEIGVFFGSYELTATLTGAASSEVEGTEGRDRLLGTDAGETINGGAGNDRIFGNGGNDILNGDSENDAIFGGDGDDTIDGGSERDRLFGDAGNDILTGGSERDVLFGGAGQDILAGGSERDRLFGGEARDILIGDMGDDFLSGGAGDDVLMGVTGNDVLEGGAGADVFVLGVGDGTDRVKDFGIGTDKIGLVDGELTFAELTITQAGNRTILGISSSGETLAVLRGVDASALGGSSFEVVQNVATVEAALTIL
ncbi:MAG: pre-peptidase C-terminal domain-containing protein [Cyanobacteria bacterium J06560_2]